MLLLAARSAAARPRLSAQPARSTAAVAHVPPPWNERETVLTEGSSERVALEARIAKMRQEVVHVPLIIGGKEIHTTDRSDIRVPHEHAHLLGTSARASAAQVKEAIAAAAAAKRDWAALPWSARAGVFLSAAELLASTEWRSTLLAATVLNQSKNFYQADIDCVAELVDFLRFNVYYADQMLAEQPTLHSRGVWNRLAYRPLEGFVWAVTPFNFTAISGNLTSAPAMFGNTVLWKPSQHAMLSSYYVMKLFEAAGLPPGVINFVPGDPVVASNEVLKDANLGGVHFTGSTDVFRGMYKTIGDNIASYKSYPKIVGETGGKDFVFAHASADVDALSTALIRGSFEYAGQKCSAASRAYIPASLWPALKKKMLEQLQTVKLGNPEHADVLVNAVIHRGSFDKIKGFIERAKKDSQCEIVSGGTCDDSVGYFIAPTVIKVTAPRHALMTTELFGPVLTLFVYPDADYAATLAECDQATQYALTGSIFAREPAAIEQAASALEYAAGNFYINDKPTGAVVGQQPFGGARASGTNDKAGSPINLSNWVSPRTIKRTLAPPTRVNYAYMDAVKK